MLAIEPMVNAGKPAVKVLSDGWTAVTRDGSLSAHFEHTVVVTGEGCEILTLLPADAGGAKALLRAAVRRFVISDCGATNGVTNRTAEVERGIVRAQLPSGLYEVDVDAHRITAHIGGGLERNFVRRARRRSGGGGTDAAGSDPRADSEEGLGSGLGLKADLSPEP